MLENRQSKTGNQALGVSDPAIGRDQFLQRVASRPTTCDRSDGAQEARSWAQKRDRWIHVVWANTMVLVGKGWTQVGLSQVGQVVDLPLPSGVESAECQRWGSGIVKAGQRPALPAGVS